MGFVVEVGGGGEWDGYIVTVLVCKVKGFLG